MNAFLSTLFQSRIQSHVYHLQTKSYAKHKALNKYYNKIGDLIDSLAENYQGKYGIIDNYEFTSTIKNLKGDDSDIVTYFEALLKYSEKKQKTLTKDSFIQNVVDEIISLISKTLYLIRNLE